MPKAATKGHNSVDAAQIIKRLCTLLDEADGLAEDIKELKAEAKAGGLNTKALMAAIKEIRNPLDDEIKATINSYLDANGQHALFV